MKAEKSITASTSSLITIENLSGRSWTHVPTMLSVMTRWLIEEYLNLKLRQHVVPRAECSRSIFGGKTFSLIFFSPFPFFRKRLIWNENREKRRAVLFTVRQGRKQIVSFSMKVKSSLQTFLRFYWFIETFFYYFSELLINMSGTSAGESIFQNFHKLYQPNDKINNHSPERPKPTLNHQCVQLWNKNFDKREGKKLQSRLRSRAKNVFNWTKKTLVNSTPGSIWRVVKICKHDVVGNTFIWYRRNLSGNLFCNSAIMNAILFMSDVITCNTRLTIEMFPK